MAAKLPVAQKRLFRDVYVCRNCNKKIRSQSVRIIAKRIKCPRCDNRNFRAIRKK